MPEDAAGKKERKISKAFQPYVDAEWALKNYWYPALFSSELAEGELKGVKICGVPIALRRAKGKVYALKDECIHRGVELSARPMCLTDETVTCWYHGFTYDLASGELVSIVAAPDDKMIGNARLRTFPVEEKSGMIFVFVGDEDYKTPPLSRDMPHRLPEDYEHRVAHPLDDNAVLLGIHRTGNSNWRLAVENGADTGHLFIHLDNPLVMALDRQLPLGAIAESEDAISWYVDDDAPKGIVNEYTKYTPVLENKVVGLKVKGKNPWKGGRTSMFLPGVLLVENWPDYRLAQYEWYVPIDNEHHEYWEIIAAVCNTEEEKKEFEIQYENLWKNLALGQGFNDNDLFAREQMQKFYGHHSGWTDEVLCSLDAYVIAWRKLVAQHNRGLAEVPERG
ncbi:MAG: Rieske 2Fe-2S domain-containing protein [Alphaproteobacteria bacterium]